MKRTIQGKIVKQGCLLFAFAFGLVVSYAQDTIVASSSPNVFTPNSVTISVGDSVCFQGIGSLHPLVFDSDISTSYTVDNTCFVGGSSVLPEGNNNYYCSNHGGAGGVGMSGTIIVQVATGIKDVNTNDFQLTVSPNPFYEYTTLHIISGGFMINSFKVYNVIGKEIISYDLSNKKGNVSFKINLSSFKPGVYFCSLYSDKGLIETKKLVLLK